MRRAFLLAALAATSCVKGGNDVLTVEQWKQLADECVARGGAPVNGTNLDQQITRVRCRFGDFGYIDAPAGP